MFFYNSNIEGIAINKNLSKENYGINANTTNTTV